MGVRRYLQRPAQFIMRLLGWRVESGPPALPKYILVGAHHTSNWDGFLLLLVGTAIQLRVNFLMKDSMFRGVLGPFFRRLGGVSIDRSSKHNTVDQIAAAFASHDHLIIAIAPEGTRKAVDYWRSGFYYMALKANIPLVLAYADYERKAVGFSDPIWLTGDIGADMDRIRAFFAKVTPRNPANRSRIRLRIEDEAPANT